MGPELEPGLVLEPGLASGSELARALEQKSVLAQASVAGLGPLWALAWESELGRERVSVPKSGSRWDVPWE